jgi:hypothetical protein
MDPAFVDGGACHRCNLGWSLARGFTFLGVAPLRSKDDAPERSSQRCSKYSQHLACVAITFLGVLPVENERPLEEPHEP